MTWDEKMAVGMALMSEACFESEDEERYPCDRCPATRYCALIHEVAEARNLPPISHWDEFDCEGNPIKQVGFPPGRGLQKKDKERHNCSVDITLFICYNK